MEIAHLLKRIEIKFWMASVSLMKDKRLMRFLPLLLLLVLCLVLGSFSVVIAKGVFRSPFNRQAQAASAGLTPQQEIIGQSKTLVILVDDQNETSPRLDGVWLVINNASSMRLTFLPFYPASPDEWTVQDDLLASLFSLNSEGVPATVFLEALIARDVWWDNYILIDRAALAGLIELSGGIELGSELKDGELLVAQLPVAWDDPRAAVLGQAEIAKGICEKFRQLPDNSMDVNIFSEAQGRIVTDLNLEKIPIGWDFTVSDGKVVTCEFPSL
jgi:hypothetical protein